MHSDPLPAGKINQSYDQSYDDVDFKQARMEKMAAGRLDVPVEEGKVPYSVVPVNITPSQSDPVEVTLHFNDPVSGKAFNFEGFQPPAPGSMDEQYFQTRMGDIGASPRSILLSADHMGSVATVWMTDQQYNNYLQKYQETMGRVKGIAAVADNNNPDNLFSGGDTLRNAELKRHLASQSGAIQEAIARHTPDISVNSVEIQVVIAKNADGTGRIGQVQVSAKGLSARDLQRLQAAVKKALESNPIPAYAVGKDGGVGTIRIPLGNNAKVPAAPRVTPVSPQAPAPQVPAGGGVAATPRMSSRVPLPA